MILIIITFITYSSFNVSESEVLPGKDDGGTVFSNGMIVIVVFIIFIMVMERYTNRTATKAPDENQGLDGDENIDTDDRAFFKLPSLILSEETLKQKKKVTRWNRNDEYKKDPYEAIKLSNDSYIDYLKDLKEKHLSVRSRIPI